MSLAMLSILTSANAMHTHHIMGNTSTIAYKPTQLNIDTGLWVNHQAHIVFSPVRYTNILHSNLHTLKTSYNKIARPVTRFLQQQKYDNKDNLGNKILQTELDSYKDMITEMDEIYDTIPSLSTHRQKRQVLIAAGIGA